MAHYRDAPPVAIEAPTEYVPDAAPAGLWPGGRGGAGQTGRSGNPLRANRFVQLWSAEVGEATDPDLILVGDELVLLGGVDGQRIFGTDGGLLGGRRPGNGAPYIDIAGQRLLADDREGGLFTHRLPEGRPDGRVMLSPSREHTTRQILPGPGLLVFVSVRPAPFGPSRDVIVEAVRPRDWGNVSEHGIFYGLQPLAGIIHDVEGSAAAAAGRAGPVVALPGGLHWCDWLLRPLADHLDDWTPLALSADVAGRAHLLVLDNGATRFLIVPPGGPPILDLELATVEPAATLPSPVMTSGGRILLALPGQLLSFDPSGQRLWEQVRVGVAPATASSNGFFLTVDEALVAIAADGRRIVLWEPPEALVTAPILVGDRIYVASQAHLFALRAA
jgi:hypothetical protein